MDAFPLARRLESNAAVFRHLLEGVNREQARWRPAPEQWSLLEVINHLADEEAEDFRRRLRLTLERPGEGWPPIDPESWPRGRAYAERDLESSVARFLAERTESVGWLRAIGTIDLGAGHDHPERGWIAATALAAAWSAHDLIHIRQLTRLHYQYLHEAEGARALAYAGRW
jgi:hypothetical protein